MTEKEKALNELREASLRFRNADRLATQGPASGSYELERFRQARNDAARDLDLAAKALLAIEDAASPAPAGHTPGPWRVGTNNHVVCDVQHPGNHQMKVSDAGSVRGSKSDLEYYGGYLLAESIARRSDAVLMALSPELLDLAKEVFAYLDALDIDRLRADTRAMLDKAAMLIARSERLDG